MGKDSNIVMDATPLTTIHLLEVILAVVTCELKEEIYEYSSAYADEIIGRREVINLEDFEDKDELVIEHTYPGEMKTIKCGLGEMSREILMIRHSIPRSITICCTLIRRSITNPPNNFVVTRCKIFGYDFFFALNIT